MPTTATGATTSGRRCLPSNRIQIVPARWSTLPCRLTSSKMRPTLRNGLGSRSMSPGVLKVGAPDARCLGHGFVRVGAEPQRIERAKGVVHDRGELRSVPNNRGVAGLVQKQTSADAHPTSRSGVAKVQQPFDGALRLNIRGRLVLGVLD